MKTSALFKEGNMIIFELITKMIADSISECPNCISDHDGKRDLCNKHAKEVIDFHRMKERKENMIIFELITKKIAESVSECPNCIPDHDGKWDLCNKHIKEVIDFHRMKDRKEEESEQHS